MDLADLPQLDATLAERRLQRLVQLAGRHCLDRHVDDLWATLLVIHVMTFWLRMEFLIVDEGWLSERTGFAASECPLTTITVLGPNITVDVRPPISRRVIGAGSVHRIKIPEGEISGVENELHHVGGI